MKKGGDYISCYRPLYGKFIGFNTDSGKPNYKVLGTRYHADAVDDPRDVAIPCGKCIGCKLDYSRQWADRMMLELDHSKTALFLTLTYDKDHIKYGIYGETYTLHKNDCQLFFKRLRDHFPSKHIRYYLCGEYGTNTLRPHYHCIVYDFCLADFPDLQVYSRSRFNQFYYSSEYLNSIWQNGNVIIGSVSWQTCAYTARYATKKLEHDNLDYARLNIQPEFALMSRRPGIGGFFYQDHPELLGKTRFFISDANGVTPRNEIFLPKYLLNSLEKVNPVLYNKIKADKAEYAKDARKFELSLTSLDEEELDDCKAFLKLDSANTLKRG